MISVATIQRVPTSSPSWATSPQSLWQALLPARPLKLELSPGLDLSAVPPIHEAHLLSGTFAVTVPAAWQLFPRFTELAPSLSQVSAQVSPPPSGLP